MADTRLPVGTSVQVRNHFERTWSSGFEVAGVRTEGASYRVRRVSDHVVLPEPFGVEDLRPEHGMPRITER
jgi:hypothetical protein